MSTNSLIPSHNGSEEVQGSIDDVGMELPEKKSSKEHKSGKTCPKKNGDGFWVQNQKKMIEKHKMCEKKVMEEQLLNF